MSESTFTTAVIAMAEALGWKVWHVPYPVRPVGGNRFVPEPRAKGLPDLIMLHPSGRLILAELKNVDGKVSDEQALFLRLARTVADSMRHRLAGIREVLNAAGVTCELVDEPVPLGVYTWRPGMEELIEATLRSKVLTRQ